MVHAFESEIQDVILTPGPGGSFEVIVDGTLIYSKLKTHEFPDENDMVDQLSAISKQVIR